MAHVRASDVSNGHKEQTQLYGRLYIMPQCHHHKISTMSRRAWQDIIDAAYREKRYDASGREKPPLSRKTLDKLRGFIVHFCTWMVKDKELLTRNDIPMLDTPKSAPKVRRAVLQPEDIRTLFAHVECAYRGKVTECFYIYAFRFLVASGLRPGEMFGLRHEDIQAGKKTVRRSINVHGEITEGKTENAIRESMLTELEKSILANQAEMLKRLGIISPWVFPGKGGDAINYDVFLLAWNRYKRYHCLPERCNLYYLRHTMASVNKSLPDALLKPIMGHSKSMDTDKVYKHALASDAELAKSQIDENFLKILEG